MGVSRVFAEEIDMTIRLVGSWKNRDTPHSAALFEATHQLGDIVEALIADGFDEEAASLETVIRDLDWQYEEILDKELAAQWPHGPRRPLRASTRPVG